MPFLLDKSSGRRYELGDADSIGRDPSSSILLVDRKVSARHAEVRRTPEGRHLLADVGSRNGTFVDGERVLTVLLADGDEVKIGMTVLRFQEHSALPIPSRIEPPRLSKAMTSQVMQRLQVEGEPSFRPASELEAPGELRRGYEKLRVAHELLRVVGVEDDLERLLERILAAAFRLLEADRATVLLVDEASGAPVHRMSRRRDGHPDEVVISQTILAEVIHQKAGVLTSDAATDDRFSRARSVVIEGIRSAMCVPMLVGEELLGVMHLDSLLATNVFTDEDLELFTSIACQAAMVVKHTALRARLTEEARAREGVEREMQIARRIQTALLPATTSAAGYSIAGAMVPAEVVGGDYYDVLEYPAVAQGASGRLWLAIGDVSSHGVTPGLIMMMTQSVVAALTARDPSASPSQVFVELNRVLYENVHVRLGETNHMTLTLLRSDGGGRFTYAGKHLDLALRRAATGEVEFLRTSGTWLGVLPDVEGVIADQEVSLSPGDLLVLYTDGVTEACDGEGQMLEQEGLALALGEAGPSAEEACAALISAAEAHAERQDDDVTVLVIRREP